MDYNALLNKFGIPVILVLLFIAMLVNFVKTSKNAKFEYCYVCSQETIYLEKFCIQCDATRQMSNKAYREYKKNGNENINSHDH